MSNKDPLLESPVTSTMLSLTYPVSLGMLSTFLFQAVDTWFVGKLGSAELAALSFSATVYMLLVGAFMGLAVGASALVAEAAGGRDLKRASTMAGNSLLIALTISVILSAVGTAAWNPIFRLMGADEVVRPLVGDYMKPMFVGFPFLALGLTGSAVLRSHGDARFPEIIFALSGLINLVLDWLLIFGIGPFPALGIKGAALATVVSWIILMVVILARLFRQKHLSFNGVSWAGAKEILSVATPALGAQLTVPASMLIITFLAARSGAMVVAALGVAMRIENLLLVGASSVAVSIIPFIARNSGAGEAGRVDQGMVFAGKAAFYWGGFLFITLFFLGGPLASLFTGDEVIISYTRLYFRIISVSYAGLGLTTVTASILNGLRKSATALKILGVKTFLIALPLLIIGSFFGAMGLFTAIAAGHIIGGIFAAGQMRKVFREMGSELTDRKAWKDYGADARLLLSAIRNRNK